MNTRFDWFGNRESQVNYGTRIEPPASISDAATAGVVYKCYADHEPADDSRVHVQRTVVAANVTTKDHTVVKWRHRGSAGVVYKPIHEAVSSGVNDAWYAALPVISAAGAQAMSGYKDSALASQGVAATVSSEDATLAFALKAGSSLPAGVSLNATTGALTGTPSAVGTGAFTVVVSAAGDTDIDPVEVVVSYAVVLPSIVAEDEQSISGYQGTALVSQGVSATTIPSGLPLTYGVKSGSTLPAGVSLNTSSGALTGTPTAAGIGAFIVAISENGADAVAVEVEVAYEIVLPVINAATPQTLAGTEDVALDGQGVLATSTPAGLTLGYALKAGSTLPAGVSLNAATGALTGTPTTAGTGAFTIVVSDDDEDAVSVEVVVDYEIAAAGE